MQTTEEVVYTGFAGGSATFAAEMCYYPIETIKNRNMASTMKKDFIVTANTVSKMKGVQQQIFNSFPYGFVFFALYENCKVFLEQHNKTYESINHLVSAGIAESGANLFKNPFEVIKNQMQVGLGRNMRQTSIEIYQAFGLKGFYQGLGPIIIRDIIYSMLNLTVYEKLKKTYNNHFHVDVIDHVGAGVCGFSAGAVAAFFTTPIDVIKVKLMIQRQLDYKGSFDCISQIMKEEGIKGFFRAWHLRVLGISLTNIVYFTVYEKIRFVLLSDCQM